MNIKCQASVVIPAFNEEKSIRSLQSAVNSSGFPLSVLSVEGEEARDLYESTFALIRPDQIVAWRGNQLPNKPQNLLKNLSGN